MAKLAPPKKASKPTAPKKPTSRSKTGNAACSSAASNWQLALRGKAALDPETYRTLAKCRAMNRTAKMAEAQGRTGKLSAMGESAVKARLQVRFDSGLITQKARTERLDMLLKQRSQRGKASTNSTESPEPQARKGWADLTENDRKVFENSFVGRMRGTVEDTRRIAQTAGMRYASEAVLSKNKGGTPDAESIRKFKKYADENNYDFRGILKDSGYLSNLREYRDARNWMSMPDKSSDIEQIRAQSAEKVRLLVGKVKSAKQKIEQPKPAARYSLGGKLAPGRGTEERNNKAAVIKMSRTLAQKSPGGGKTIFGIVPSKVHETVARARVAKQNPPKFSRNGQLAPGRGTVERKQQAEFMAATRNLDAGRVAGVLNKNRPGAHYTFSATAGTITGMDGPSGRVQTASVEELYMAHRARIRGKLNLPALNKREMKRTSPRKLAR